MAEETAGGGEGVGDAEGIVFTGTVVTVGVFSGEGRDDPVKRSHPASPTAATNKTEHRVVILLTVEEVSFSIASSLGWLKSCFSYCPIDMRLLYTVSPLCPNDT